MKTALLLLALLPCRLAMAQSAAVLPPPLPPLPETSLQPTIGITTVSNAPGVRYQYQLVHFDNNQYIWLAPAWRGQTKLEPSRRLFNYNLAGELDVLLMTQLNELAAEGWDLVEVRSTVQPVGAVQKLETDLTYNDPKRPSYKATTSIETQSQTRYLFRRALPPAQP